MSNRLHFAPSFARKMAFLSILVGTAIALLMPLTSFLINWHKFSGEAHIRCEDIAWRVQETVRTNPSLWYYSVPKFLDGSYSSNRSIQSIIVYDKYSNVKFKTIINEDIFLTYPFRVPVLYNNEIWGFIEIYVNTLTILIDTLVITALFLIIGIGIGSFLYWYPVHIVKLVEKDVQTYTEHAKQQADSEVARLDRLKLVGQMAASIAHEVRNPLTTVKGYLQLFSRKTDFLPFFSQIHLMIEELDRANNIITEFLSLSHKKTVTMKQKNLNHVIQALQPLIQSNGNIRGISVKYDLQNIPDIILDEKEVRQLILNITCNGFEAMKSGQCLSIKTKKGIDGVVLSIIDQGEGIDKNLLSKLGTPFFTTKETGTGLGLAVCYSIAHRHSATINFASGNTGTTFSITFPLPQTT